jgi:cytochrome c-type biogenesis protein
MTPDVASGSLVVAAGISLAAGAVSFASPCVLPLVPGYLGFVSGLSGADMAEGRPRVRAAVVAGTGLFVLGFAVFFTLIGGAFGALGAALVAQRELLGRVGGVLVASLGLFLLGVWRPQRLEREHRGVGLVRRGGLLAAFPLGVVFGAGWTPCIGPTLAAILTLTTAGQDASPARGAVLAFRLRGRPRPAVPGRRGGATRRPPRVAVAPRAQHPGPAGRRGHAPGARRPAGDGAVGSLHPAAAAAGRRVPDATVIGRGARRQGEDTG